MSSSSSSYPANEYLQAQKLSFPELGPLFDELGQLQQKKLWHQLTEKLLSLLTHPHFQSDQRLLHLHNEFISKLSKKLNAYFYAQLAVCVSRQYSSFTDAEQFLSALIESIPNAQPAGIKAVTDAGEILQANIIIKCELIKLKIHYGIDVDQQQKTLLEIKKSMDAYNGILDEKIHSAYYHAAMAIDQSKGPAALGDYYQHAILFLTYKDLSSIPTEEEKLSLASSIGEAALLGKNVYNFGELLQHPLFTLLENNSSSNEKNHLLSLLLKAFNNGNITEFQSLYPKAKTLFNAFSSSTAESFLQEKIRIMALIELCFQRPINDRTLLFSEISTTCVLETSKVEYLLMKALAFKIIKGSIDQVNQTVRITWVQPRVLHMEQIKNIKQKLIQWNKDVQNTANYLDENSMEILQQHNQ